MRLFLNRLGPCILGYLWAAFFAAAALTALRAASDVSRGAMPLIDALSSAPYFVCFMTAVIIATAFLPALPAIVVGEAWCALRVPVPVIYYVLAGAAVGWYLTLQFGSESAPVFSMPAGDDLLQVISGGFGGLGFWYVGARKPKTQALPV